MPALRETLHVAVADCRRAGVTLGLENEPACTIGTGTEAATLFAESTGQDGLTIIWDPGNAAAMGEQPYPAGYAGLRTASVPISHVHIKDLAHGPDPTGKSRFVPVTEGTIDYTGQLMALAVDGYRGVLSLEPHIHRGPMSMRRCIAGLRGALTAAEQRLMLQRHVP